MNEKAATLPPDVPPDVLVYAEAMGLASYLPQILELSRQAFPQAPPRLFLEKSYDPPYEVRLFLEVATEGMDEAAFSAASERWYEGLHGFCPKPQRFRVGLSYV
jgi:hypothetical protein